MSDADKWYVTPDEYVELRLVAQKDDLNGTRNLESFVLRVFGKSVELVVTPNGERP